MISPGPLAPVADFGPTDRLNGWIMTAVVSALAAVTRFLNLQSPTDAGTPIFDEKHYAPQAWQMLHNSGIEDNPGFGLVVHPPLGKQLIAIGEAVFGYNGFGWRFSVALLGVAMVAIVARTVRRISRSTVIGGIAGLLLIADGVTFVASRTALLDGVQVFFIVAAFGALMVDRDDVRARMHRALLDGRIDETEWGPRLGVRWWLRPYVPAAMRRPVDAYVLVITVMVALSLGCVAAGGTRWIAVGTILFWLSDLTVARDRFIRHELRNRLWGLPLYYGAQLVLACTIAA